MRCPDVLAVYPARSMKPCVWLPAHPQILSRFSPGLWWLLRAKWSRTSLVIMFFLPLDSRQTWLDEIFVFLILRRPNVSSPFDWLLNGSQALLFGVAVVCLVLCSTSWLIHLWPASMDKLQYLALISSSPLTPLSLPVPQSHLGERVFSPLISPSTLACRWTWPAF